MMVTLFHDKLYEKNMKNLQTKLYLALFSDFEYLVPLQSNEIFFRVSSEKTYCKSHLIDFFELTRKKISLLFNGTRYSKSEKNAR